MTRIIQVISDFFGPVAAIFRSVSKRFYFKAFFLIIPVVFMVNAVVIHYNIGKFFMRSVDPEYFYLYNGVMMGQGSLSMQYTANPGTPLQALFAVTSAAIGIFQPGSIVGDVVNDPEKYIHATSLLMIFMISLTLFLGGWYTWKVTGSWLAALLLQMGIPCTAEIMILTGRLNAEAMMILPVLLLSIAVIGYIFTSEDREYPPDKTLVIFGLVCGFGAACKISFFPLVLIPLIMLNATFRQKLKLIAYSLLSFAVFGYPVVFNNGHFWNWVGNVLSHTGKYGEGPKGFIDFTLVPERLSQLFRDDQAFFIIVFISLVSGIIFSFKYFKKPLSPVLKRITRVFLAVPLAVILCMILVLKHFELYYFIPFYVFKFLLISLLFLFIIRIGKAEKSLIFRTVTIIGIIVIVAFISYTEGKKIRSANQQYSQKKELQEVEYRQVMSVYEPGSPIILSGNYYGTPFIEFAHYDGFKMSGKIGKSFVPYLKAKFPVSYQYVSWSDRFYYWDAFVDIHKILEKSRKPLYIFIGETKAGDLPVIEERLWKVIDRASVSREIVYRNESNGDQLIKIRPLSNEFSDIE